MDYGSEGWLEKGGLARPLSLYRRPRQPHHRYRQWETRRRLRVASYVSPAVIDQYLEGTTIEDFGPAICAWSGPGISASTVKNKPF